MKLHLRDLFWLVLVCALMLGWWIDRSRIAANEAATMKRAEQFEMEAAAHRASVIYLQETMIVERRSREQAEREEAKRMRDLLPLVIESPAHEAIISGKDPQ